MLLNNNYTFSNVLECIALEVAKGATPDTPVRLLSSAAENVYVLNMLLRKHLTISHAGHITQSILYARKESENAGTPVQIFFVDEKRERFRPFEEIALNPSSGRILFCAVGLGDAPQIVLRKLAGAERRWPREEKLLDSDGFSRSAQVKQKEVVVLADATSASSVH